MQNINSLLAENVNGKQSCQLLMTVNNNLKCGSNWKNKKYLNNLANNLLVVFLDDQHLGDVQPYGPQWSLQT
jgi:hypothetical protein